METVKLYRVNELSCTTLDFYNHLWAIELKTGETFMYTHTDAVPYINVESNKLSVYFKNNFNCVSGIKAMSGLDSRTEDFKNITVEKEWTSLAIQTTNIATFKDNLHTMLINDIASMKDSFLSLTANMETINCTSEFIEKASPFELINFATSLHDDGTEVSDMQNYTITGHHGTVFNSKLNLPYPFLGLAIKLGEIELYAEYLFKLATMENAQFNFISYYVEQKRLGRY